MFFLRYEPLRLEGSCINFKVFDHEIMMVMSDRIVTYDKRNQSTQSVPYPNIDFAHFTSVYNLNFTL